VSLKFNPFTGNFDFVDVYDATVETLFVKRDGTLPMTANWNYGGFDLTNLNDLTHTAATKFTIRSESIDQNLALGVNSSLGGQLEMILLDANNTIAGGPAIDLRPGQSVYLPEFILFRQTMKMITSENAFGSTINFRLNNDTGALIRSVSFANDDGGGFGNYQFLLGVGAGANQLLSGGVFDFKFTNGGLNKDVIFEVTNGGGTTDIARFTSGGIFAGKTTTSGELELRGTTASNLGQIRCWSPIRFETTVAANALNPYTILADATETITGVFIGGTYADQRTIDFDNATFIYETLRGTPNITSGVAPAFAAFTLFQALPILASGTGATHNPLQAIVLNGGPTIRHLNTGTRTTVNNLVVSCAQQIQSKGGGTMNVSNTTGLSFSPTFSTTTGSTVNLGNVRGVLCKNPAVALFQTQSGVETMTSYHGVDVEAIPFNGNVIKVGFRSRMAVASLTWGVFMDNAIKNSWGGGDHDLCGNIDCESLDVNNGVALGGGVAPTLGTIGGSGPTAAAQSQWLQVEINGTSHWIPAWI